MRAVKLVGKKQLATVETDTPKTDGNQVIIKVSRVGICGSDIHIWEKGERSELIMGHEFCGTVVDPGALKDTISVGDRVAVIPLNPCGKCGPCTSGQPKYCVNSLAASPGVTATGGYAEYYAARPYMVRKLPDEMSDDEAAMIEPTAVALRAVRLAGFKPGDKVLVTGGGIIGLLCAAWSRIYGASYLALTEANPLRVENALKMGDVDAVFDATDQQLVPKLIEATGGGFDHVLECAAVAPAVNTGIMALKKNRPHGSGGSELRVGTHQYPACGAARVGT
ncbi:MAG: alcohol dehydrogenase catalytic domain-containing protein [Firmicutes bacterium]|nr:alcohol dehydrogenase catalytic domain-containing protein [Bacillota bacterium]